MTKLSRYIIGVAVAAVIIFLVWYFSNIVAYVLISAVLAIIGKPLVNFLVKIKIRGRVRIPKWLAAFVTMATFWIVLSLFFYIFIPLVFDKVHELSKIDFPQLIESFREPLMSLQLFIQNLFGVSGSEFSIIDSLAQQIAPIFNINLINNILSSLASTIGNTVVALFSITFITFFFLKEDHLFFDMVIAIFPTKYEENITRALDSITTLLIRYFTGIVAESAIIVTIISIVLMIFGFTPQTAFFMGFIMGILNVIPYIGPIIGASLCIIIGILTPLDGVSAWNMVLIIGGVIACVKGIDDFVLQPTLYSNRVKAHPLEIFLVILIAGSVAGVLGMLLAIPAYNVIRVFAKEFFNNFSLVQKLTNKI